MKKGIALMMLVVAVVALAGCGLPDLSAPDKPVERPVKSAERRPKVSTTTTTAEVEADTTTTVASADADTPAPSTGTAGNAPVAPSSGSSGGATSTPTPASTGQASASQSAAGTSAGGDTGTCAYPGRCTSDPHRNGEVGRSGQVAGTTATPVGAGGE